MADNAPSDDERNRRLARRIGVLRDQGRSLDDAAPSDDEVVRALRAYRAEQDVSPSSARSERLWAAIEAETQPAAAPSEPERKPATIFTLPSAWPWAVAASLVLAGVLAWLFLTGAPEPVQVAAADATIEMYTAPDGSTIRLRPHSQLYRFPGEDERRYRLTGEALFAVTPRAEAPFIVEAGALRVRVLGTTFNVRTWGRPAVFLQEGVVQLARASADETVQLAPGQQSGLTAAGTLALPTASDSAEALDWLNDEMIFTARSAASVVDEVEQHFGMAIELPEAVRDETLSGRIVLAERAQSLADLGMVLGGRFQRIDGQTYRFIAEETP